VNNRLRHLRSLWKKHWKPAGLVTANPWADVPMLNAPRGKRVRVPGPGAVRAFYDWLAARYPGWELPRLFVFVNALAGCRTRDLCHARTADLTATSLTLAASATKTRQARTLRLPADVLADLRRLAGPVFVWERAAAELRTHRPAKSDPHAGGFSPESSKHTVENLFREVNEGRPKTERVRPHDLRAGAMTVAAKLYGSADKVARVMGGDVQTARHYIDGLAFEAEDDAARLHDALRV
jgi:integrase